ncbi:MAG: TIGR00268 family protein [Thaumarchaeota archaeon]|nr:TIGR00268 family protein [Nitrososphaerota archaeon]
MKKYQDLLNWFSNKNSVLISLSGGVDSALVAYAAFEKIGKHAIAVTADYKTLAQDELDSAKKIVHEIGIKHMIISYDELENENFVKNDKNRCFYCRDELSEKLLILSKQLGTEVIVDGTHTDDLGDYRPGIEALHKNGIRSPLLETNFTKQDIRDQTKIIGLSIYDRPSNSCLASRIPWGQRVTAERLARVEMGELIIKQSIDTKQVRVRDLDGIAKIEVDIDKIPLLRDNQKIEEISEKLQMLGFSSVQVDYDGYMPGKVNF